MRLSGLLFFALALRSSAVIPGEPSPEVSNEESFFPVTSVQENSIEVNKTRYKLDNISFKALAKDTHVAAIVREWPDRMSLLHPNFWTYWIHSVAQIIAAIMALKCRLALLIILVAAVLCWPISLALNTPIWAMQPLAADWVLMCAKSVIVNICPTVPMLVCLIKRPSRKWCHRAGIWTYCILWANVFWTLFFLPMAFNPVSVTNAVCGLSLCISLIIHLVAVCKKGVSLFEVKGDIVYGYGTSLSWLVCYTVWNALFVVELAIGLILQDIAFWAMMIFFYYWSQSYSGLENYFAMARPISLSAFIATSDWPGLLEYWRGAEPLGLDLTSHAFFLFLASANVLFSFYVLYWAVCCLLGRGGARAYFNQTIASQKDMQIDDEESEVEYSDLEAEEDEE